MYIYLHYKVKLPEAYWILKTENMNIYLYPVNPLPNFDKNFILFWITFKLTKKLPKYWLLISVFLEYLIWSQNEKKKTIYTR